MITVGYFIPPWKLQSDEHHSFHFGGLWFLPQLNS